MINKTFLVTGGAGFIGSNLVEQLLKLDQIVVGLDNFSTGKKKNILDVGHLVEHEQWGRFTFVEGDVRDADACLRAVRGVDYVLHQAALGSVAKPEPAPQTSLGRAFASLKADDDRK